MPTYTRIFLSPPLLWGAGDKWNECRSPAAAAAAPTLLAYDDDDYDDDDDDDDDDNAIMKWNRTTETSFAGGLTTRQGRI